MNSFKQLVKSTFSFFATNIVKSGKVNRVLLIGANGQIGSEMRPYLKELYGIENVLYTDIRKVSQQDPEEKFQLLDLTNKKEVEKTIKNFRPDQIISMAAILSASSEKDNKLSYRVNIEGFKNVIDLALEQKISFFSPSTIAAFGSSTPKDNTPNTTIMRPGTFYGATKVFNELLGTYYNKKYGLNFRALRYPQVISKTLPVGGSGDYTVEIFYDALKHKHYKSFVGPNTKMPVIYKDDVVEATLAFIEAPEEKLTERVYNVQSCGFTLTEMAEAIQVHIPEFTLGYKIDFREAIVNSWPRSMDDSLAKKD